MRVQHAAATLVAESGQQLWVVDGTRILDDGTEIRHVHEFPVDTLEWRAAEYGIDPSDTATLLDIVLAEPHLSEEDWATGHQLHAAPDIDTARQDHLARCSRAKLRHRITTRTKDHPCRRVADESPMDLEAIELKRVLVEQARATYAHARQAPRPDRLVELRAAVERTKGGGRE